VYWKTRLVEGILYPKVGVSEKSTFSSRSLVLISLVFDPTRQMQPTPRTLRIRCGVLVKNNQPTNQSRLTETEKYGRSHLMNTHQAEHCTLCDVTGGSSQERLCYYTAGGSVTSIKTTNRRRRRHRRDVSNEHCSSERVELVCATRF
jgi:hypothetical protein